ncbi:recombinase family protein [Hydrogenophaga sp.]|uniref:recombinase family protein n=1 Tax=Hydrogenophaga sp. TaxID=1904254 RepID=UPI002FC7129B
MTKPSTPRRAALYARVSTDRQSTENQLCELREVAERQGWVVVAEFVDHGISGSKGRADRPKLDAMMKGLARKEFDVVASWSVDRLGRSLIDLVTFLQELHATGVDLYLHQQGVNTTTPAGRALFQMMGVFAEFEREIIRERVKAGLARAKAKGTKSGNPIGRPGVGEKVEERIRALRAEGMGIAKVAKMVGCGVSVVQRVSAQVAA